MKLIFLFLYLFLVSSVSTAQAPRWKWAIKAGGNRAEQMGNFNVDKDGNKTLLFGSQSDLIRLSNINITANNVVNGSRDTQVFSKFDSIDSLKWVIKSPQRSSISGSSFINFALFPGNFTILSGVYFNNFQLMGRILPGDGFSRKFALKMDGSNNQSVWLKEVKFSILKYDFNRHFYASILMDKADTIDGIVFPKKGYYLAKIDTSFRVLKSRFLGGQDSIGTSQMDINSISVNKNNRVVVCGTYNTKTPLDTSSWKLPGFGNYRPDIYRSEGFVSFWDENLNFISAKAPTARSVFYPFTTLFSEIKRCKALPNGDFFVAGEYQADSLILDSLAIVSGFLPFEQGGKRNIFSFIMDENGSISNPQKYASRNDDFLFDACVDSLSNVYLAGIIADNFQVGNNTITDQFILKSDRKGKAHWVKGVDSRNGPFLYLSVDKKGNLYTAGQFGKFNSIPPITSFNLDTISLPWTPSAPGIAQQVDLFLARLGNCNLARPVLSGPSNQSFCKGDSLTLTCSPFQKYQWSTGDTTQSISVKKPGAYHCYIYDSLGCYARSQTVVVTETPIRTSSLSVSICPGENFLGYDTAGTYTDTLVSSLGCDSIRTLALSLKPNRTFNQSIRLCKNETLQVGPRIYSQPGIYLDTLTASNGCDSLITSTLNYDIPNDTIQLSAPLGALAAPGQDSYQWLDCNLGFAPITGETDSSFAPSVSGSYAVRVTKGACADTSNCLLITSGSRIQCRISELEVFPNPNSGKATVRWRAGTPGEKLWLSTVEGKLIKILVLQANQLSSFSGLPKGVYVVKPERGGARPVRVMVE